MKNIIEICKEYGFEIPAEKHADFLKAVAAEYKTNVEHSKVVEKLELATKRAETAEEALKGFEGINPEEVSRQIAEANKKVKEAREEADRLIAERDMKDAINSLLSDVEFTSPAAKRDVFRQLKEKGLTLENETLKGGKEALDEIRKAEPESFVVKADANRPKFTDPKPAAPSGNTSVVTDIRNTKDPAERQAKIAQFLRTKKGLNE